MLTPTQFIALGAAILLVFILGALFHSGKRNIKKYRLAHLNKLDEIPYCFYAFTDFEIRLGNKVSYFNAFTPSPVVFNDVLKGDFQETQYGLINERDGVVTYPTKTAALEKYKPHSDLALIAITVDRNGRMDMESLPIPGRDVTPYVGAGFQAFKEERTPNDLELREKYK